MKKYLPIVYTFIFLNGCISKPIEGYDCAIEVQTNSSSNAICYVLCDFSASVGSPSIKDIVNNAKKVLTSLSREYEIRYYDVTDSGFLKPFFEYLPPLIGKMETPLEKRNRDSFASCQANKLSQKLDNLYNKNANTTCIVDEVKDIGKDLSKNKIDKNAMIKIVILSDMQECCLVKVGKLDLEKSENFKSTMKNLEKIPDTPVFSVYKNLEIIVAGSSHKHIERENIEDFWGKVWEKFGYSKPVPITASLPSSLTNKR